MGYALARAAREAGAEVCLITGPTSLVIPQGVRSIPIVTTADLAAAVQAEFATCDALIMAAAPADFRPQVMVGSKIKRGDGPLALQLEPTEDILRGLAGKRRPGQVVIGFALETDDAEKNARRKLADKQLDMIVLNVPGPDSGFDTETNRVSIIRPKGRTLALPLMSKDEVAERIVAEMTKLL
jgi:phosphopantothenoylcysteine decarboxylase / phosphopantothenate---cysteine ligase